jgi:FtsH-binding integral membrane protein
MKGLLIGALVLLWVAALAVIFLVIDPLGLSLTLRMALKLIIALVAVGLTTVLTKKIKQQ